MHCLHLTSKNGRPLLKRVNQHECFTIFLFNINDKKAERLSQSTYFWTNTWA